MLLSTVLLLLAVLNLIGLIFLILKKPQSNIQMEIKQLGNEISKINDSLRQEMALNRGEVGEKIKENREEQANSFARFENTLRTALTTLTEQQNVQAEKLNTKLEERLRVAAQQQNEQAEKLNTKLEERLRVAAQQQNEQAEKLNNKLEERLRTLQEENAKKLEQMRQTVDEKLQATVEKRFTESFTLISDRLEQVHKGLGEMQNIAVGVGDLKKVLSNVKSRGVLGEIQLSMILEDLLPAEYLVKNAQMKAGTSERVEFAIKMPGRNSDSQPVLLPIDSKFPIEDYRRLTDAIESMASEEEIKQLNKVFENSIKKNAKDIKEKYINPPTTTEFALMFVPTEGLYSEIVKRNDLFYNLVNEYKITVVGPSNLVVILNALTWGFKTLAIEKRSSEVWDLLGKVKTEFVNFGDLLAKTKEKLVQTTNVLENAERKSRVIERKLHNVQAVDGSEGLEQLVFVDSEE